MDADGISKACMTKVIMNRPETNTAAMEPINSIQVSRCFGGFSPDGFSFAGAGFALFFFFAKGLSHLTSRIILFQRTYSQRWRKVNIKPAVYHQPPVLPRFP